MKSALGPEGLSGGVVIVLREVVGSPFHVRLERSVSCTCAGNQKSPLVGQRVSSFELS